MASLNGGSAFKPNRNHLPGYVTNAEVIRAKSIDAIVVTAVNDVFVLNAWAEGGAERGRGIEFLADGNGDFARALGLTYEGVANGLGTRSQRYAMIVEDGVVRVLNIEDALNRAGFLGGILAWITRLGQAPPSERSSALRLQPGARCRWAQVAGGG